MISLDFTIDFAIFTMWLQMCGWTDGQTDGQNDGQTDRMMGAQTNKWMDIELRVVGSSGLPDVTAGCRIQHPDSDPDVPHPEIKPDSDFRMSSFFCASRVILLAGYFN